MDLQISEFDILVCFAGVKTKEGQDFIDCIERIVVGRGPGYLSEFTVYLENNSYISGDYVAMFKFNPSYSKMAMPGLNYGNV